MSSRAKHIIDIRWHNEGLSTFIFFWLLVACS